MRVKMSKPPPPAPTASAVGSCPTFIKIVLEVLALEVYPEPWSGVEPWSGCLEWRF